MSARFSPTCRRSDLYFIARASKIEQDGAKEEVEEEYPRAVDSELDPADKAGEVSDETMAHELVKQERKRRPNRGHKKKKKRLQQRTNGGEEEGTHWQEQGQAGEGQ